VKDSRFLSPPPYKNNKFDTMGKPLMTGAFSIFEIFISQR
jgi:hypothetical protein